MTPGLKFHAHMAAARQKQSTPMTKDQWVAAAEVFLDAEYPPAKKGKARRTKQDRPRNPLFDALADACGHTGTPTRTAARTIGSALAEIREVAPDVTPEEITRRAGLILRKYEKGGPFAVSAHWGEHGGKRTSRAAVDTYTAPPAWKARFLRAYPQADADRFQEWTDVPVYARTEIMRQIEAEKSE